METYVIGDKIKVFQYGRPIETGAVVAKREKKKIRDELNIDFEKDYSCINIKLCDDEQVYGLGENLGGINKRGRIYESYCTDDPIHTENKTRLYSSHNFFIISGKKSKGYFIDYPSKIKYDIGYTNRENFTIKIFGKDFLVYVIEGDSLKDIVTNFLKIIGKSYIPPKWAFGYFQSRWGYRNKSEVKQVCENFRRLDIPLEGIFLDLDYMDDFKIFTISEERFGQFKDFVQELKEDGLYLVPIIDAGVKIEKGYSIYEEGIEGDFFCKDEEGKPYEAAVWPGKVHFPDFMKEEVQNWFGSKYKVLTDCGVEGFWNDMNEPAIFYHQDSLDEAINYAISNGKDLDTFSYFKLKDNFNNLANKELYYKSFYHEVDGKTVSNHELHNMYGYYMTKSSSIGISKLLKNKRFLLISRASAIGMHRYSGIWTGDNESWWSHIELNLKMLPSLNMCGFFYIGADTGGFGDNCSGELLTRWLQLSVFTPLLRNHSAIGCHNQEPYAFTEEVLQNTRELIKARYRMIPYIYSEYMKSVNSYNLMFKPLSFEFDDELSKETEDQVLLGNEIMIAPVYKPNVKGRYVYFPDKMLEVSLLEKDITTKVRSKGIHYVEYGLDDLKIFLRKNTMIPLTKPSKNTKELDISNIDVVVFVNSEAIYCLYDDMDNEDLWNNRKGFLTEMRIVKANGDYEIKINNTNPFIKSINFKIIDCNNNVEYRKVSLI